MLVASYKNVSGFMSDLGRAVGALTSPLASPSLNRQGSANSRAGEMQRQWSCSSIQEGACANSASVLSWELGAQQTRGQWPY